ncbi:Uncharacterised protein [Bordetella ansorpii]|uniref:DUF3987 domain-containing protein n=1 Tax=Bordetella ansorpii TaxID=288768 RepID=A0A157SSQ2_9BORD|nr:DUF3987 domain-containing protein [Bordetella ansorpii]SAI72936.1 Uncharacterised protein [Bordetella ansorpii]
MMNEERPKGGIPRYNKKFRNNPNDGLAPKPNCLGLPNELLEQSGNTLASRFPPKTRELIEELAAEAETSADMVAAAVLATSAIPIQLLYDVQCPHIGRKPTSLFCFAILGSGLRKSTTLNSLTKVHKEFQNSQVAKAQEDDDSDVRIIVWEKKMGDLRRDIRKNAHDEEALRGLKERMVALKAEKPKTRKSGAGIMQKDITWSAMVKSLGEDAECTSWVHADASAFLPSLTHIAPGLNELWDGVTLNRKRTTTEPVYASEPRGSLFWALQEGRFQTFVKKHGADIVDVGLAARTLIVICREDDKPGNEEPRRYEIARTARDRHDSILRRLFVRYEEMLEAGAITREVLVLSEKATEQWHAAMTWIKAESHGKGAFHNIRPFGNRYMENVARVAAVLHVIEGNTGHEISADVLQYAILIVMHFGVEHEKLFGYVEKPLHEQDAQNVLLGLQTLVIRSQHNQKYVGGYQTAFNISDVKRNAHGGLTLRYSEKRIRMALDHLADQGKIAWWPVDQRQYFQVSPLLLNEWTSPSGLFVYA